MIKLSQKAVNYFDRTRETHGLRTHDSFHEEIRQFKKGGSRQWLLVELININIMDEIFYKENNDNLTFTPVEFMDAVNLLFDLTYGKKQYELKPEEIEFCLVLDENTVNGGVNGTEYRYTYLVYRKNNWNIDQTDEPHLIASYPLIDIPKYLKKFAHNKKDLEAAYQKEWQTHTPEQIPVPPTQY